MNGRISNFPAWGRENEKGMFSYVSVCVCVCGGAVIWVMSTGIASAHISDSGSMVTKG